MLEEDDYNELQKLALSLGLAASTYVRMLIKQQIQAGKLQQGATE